MASNLHSPPDNASDRQFDDAIVRLVCFGIGVRWKDLGRLLLVPDRELDAISQQYQSFGAGEMAYQMLRTWRETNSPNATVSVLTEQLKRVGRRDLVDQIMKIPPKRKEEPSSEEVAAEWLERLVSSLHDRYRNYIMKGLPWLDNNIRLADYHSNLSVETGDSNEKTAQPIDEAFQSAFSENKSPLRVLVEGLLRSGKTTLAAKLSFDHATREDYMKNFDLALHFSLRNFEGNLEGMLCRAADLADSHDQEMLLTYINNPSTRILLVLDGYDEVPQQHVTPLLALLQGHRFRHVAVVVTSRPGHFTFEKRKEERIAEQCDLNVDWNRRMTILGITKERKALFIEKHLAGFPNTIRSQVSSQLQQLEENKIIESEFLECPLFLLMIILLATDDESAGIRNLRTPTDLYKRIFGFIIRRYCSKQKGPIVRTVDLFAVSESPKPFYVDMLCQFGEFALWALTDEKLSFSQEQILGSDPQRDLRILEMGLLTQSVSTVRFLEKVVYEPVHKSLLQFSAAYTLWLQCPESDRGSWAEKVVRLWRRERYGKLLWLMMLAGLMRDRFAALLDALSPYASCGVWQEWLGRSVSETDLTESVLSSLTPFLPTHWTPEDERCFSRTQHDALLLHGIRQGRIQRVWLTGFLATPMPDDVVVDTALFVFTKHTEENVHSFNCRRLVFSLSDVFRGLATWIPSTINFQTLSFVFWSDASSDLVLLRSALTAGALKDIQIQIKCDTEETAAVVALTELIKMEKLKALSLDVESGSEELNGLLRAAANSFQLTTLILEDWRSESVDLRHLCGGVPKTWQFLSIRGCAIDLSPQTLQATCLVVLDCPESPAVLRFLEVCQVTSLQCRPPLLSAIATLPLLPQHLTELNLLLDRRYGDAEQCRLPHLPNLTVLIFTLTRDVPRSFAVRDFLFGSRSVLRLKGIEIWEAHWNEKLYVELVKGMSACLEQSIPVPTCQGTPRSSHSLQLQYFLVQSDYRDNLLAPLGAMAAHLRNKSLPRLDIVGSCSPDLVDLFSPAHGFRWETGVWGTRSEDAILRRMEYDTQYLSFFNCYSIRHTDN